MAAMDVTSFSAFHESAGLFNNVSLKRKRDQSSTDKLSKPEMGIPETVSFDPARHLKYEHPKKIWSMEEIGLGHAGVSPNAVSEPFPLFTEEAIAHMRAEVLSKPVTENCSYSSNLAACQLRGYAPDYAPFIYDVWKSAEVLAIVSKIAGVELVPVMDLEIAHVNMSSNNEEQRKEAEEAIVEHEQRQLDEGVAGCPWEDDKPIVDWHTDSYPFVCVTMLSDCSQMVGGETALRTGSGDIMKVRGPEQGHAVILQGRYIEHQALRALGGSERITMVTSFRPKSAFIRDDTVLTTVRSISDLSELYGQYAEYRLEMLEERIREQLRELRGRKKAKKRFDTRSMKSFLREQEDFVASMLHELVDEEKVIKGYTDVQLLTSTASSDQTEKRVKLSSP